MTNPDPMKPTLPGDEFHAYEAPKGPVEKKPRGCFFYGCVISLIFLVLIAVGIGLLVWYGINQGNKLIGEYTDTVPQPIPVVEMPVEERKALDERIEEFKTELDAKQATEPLVLTSEQLNALIEEQPNAKGKVHVDLEGDRIKGVVSYPITEDFGPFKLKGRYLNAKGTFTASLDEGAIDVRLVEAEVRGRPIPADIMKGFADQNLAKDVKLDEEQRRTLARFERIEVKDGKLYIIPRAPSSAPVEDQPTKLETTPAEEETTPEPSAEQMPKEDASPDAEAPEEAPAPVTETPPEEPKKVEEDEATPKEPERTVFDSPVPSLLCIAGKAITMPSFPG